MPQPLILRVVLVLVALSVLYELATGVARVRGYGQYSRETEPGAYWTAILLKAAFGALLAFMAWHFSP